MWIAPEFSQYPLGRQYTHFVYSDPQSNPEYWNKPTQWQHAGAIAFQDREIRQVVASAFRPLPIPLLFNLTGGKNCIVFARYASVRPDVVDVTQQLPTQLWGYVDYAQRTGDGYWETQETPIANVFGTGWAPHKFPAPITWNDKLQRTLLLTNRSLQDVVVVLGWKVAYLNTGA